MAHKLPFKLDTKTFALIVSFILNLLGGSGTIQPLMGGLECPEAAPAPIPPLE
jgi:hypothetical protein